MKQKGLIPVLALALLALAVIGCVAYIRSLPKIESINPSPSPSSIPNLNDMTTDKASECMSETTCEGGVPCMANPASVFCVCMGGETKIVNSEEGQSGICKIDGKEYDEWEYFRSFSPSQ